MSRSGAVPASDTEDALIAEGPVLYISPTGSDTTGDGTEFNRWATPEKARAYIRANNLNAAGMSRSVVVSCAPGAYWLSDTLSLDDGDSGDRTTGAKVIYRGEGPTNGGARFCGGVLLSGWELVSGSIYKAAVSGTPWTLYENGVRAQLARTPAFVADATFPLARPPYKFSEDSGAPSHTVLQYVAGDITPAGWDLTTAGLVVDSGGNFRWFRDRLPITGINAGTRQITVSEDSRYVLFQNATGSRYFVEGVPSLLTGPGQFYVSGGFVYYWPRATPIADQEIVAPTMQRVVECIGSGSSARVTNVAFENLTLQYSNSAEFYRHASVNDNDRGGGAYDRQNTLAEHRHGLLYLENTDHVSVTLCAFKNAGFSGIFLNGYNQSDTFTCFLAERCGHSGVYADGLYPGAGDVLTGNAWRNFKIREAGELFINGSGVVLVNASANTIQYGEIRDIARYAVFIGAYTGYLAAQIYAKGNTVEYVGAYDVCQDSGDAAAFNTFGCADQANTWRQLIVAGVRAHPSMLNTPVMAGVYTDVEGGGQVFEDVQVSDTHGDPAFMAGAASTLTNCSFKADGTVDPAFNSALMQTSLIGPSVGYPWT